MTWTPSSQASRSRSSSASIDRGSPGSRSRRSRPSAIGFVAARIGRCYPTSPRQLICGRRPDRRTGRGARLTRGRAAVSPVFSACGRASPHDHETEDGMTRDRPHAREGRTSHRGGRRTHARHSMGRLDVARRGQAGPAVDVRLEVSSGCRKAMTTWASAATTAPKNSVL